mmetsp:Transcript_7818/g.32633  ORF Transcript_7818/g.32633 Transcript_7818/m.32633 type:complete len:222 (-) Transcript_7818:706-1371(-)
MSVCAICSCVTYAAAASADGVAPCALRNEPSGAKGSFAGASPQSRNACRPRQRSSEAPLPEPTFQPASAQARPSGSSSPPTTSLLNGTPSLCLWNLAPYGSSNRSPIQRACGTAVADAMSMMRTMSCASCAVMGRSSSLLSPASSRDSRRSGVGSAESICASGSTSCSISECSEHSRATDSFAERSRRARSPSASAGVRTPPSSFSSPRGRSISAPACSMG